MQEILQYSPVETGVAFLPMVATLAVTGGVCTTQLYPRVGAKPVVFAAMLFAAGAMVRLTGIGSESTYTADLLGPLMLIGIGIGAIVAPAMNAGTSGVAPHDAGIASATVNVAQQLGGSIGIALLNSLAVSALTRYMVGKDAGSPAVKPTAQFTATPSPSDARVQSSPRAQSPAA